MVRDEREFRDKIDQITTDNRELLDRNILTTAEPVDISFKRALVIINLNLLYWAVKEDRPKYRCDLIAN